MGVIGESVESDGLRFSLFLACGPPLSVAMRRFLFDFGRVSSPRKLLDDVDFLGGDGGGSFDVLSLENLAENVVKLCLAGDRGDRGASRLWEVVLRDVLVGECGLSIATLPLGSHC